MSIGLASVSDAIDRAKLSGLQVRLFVLCLALAALDGIDINTMSYSAPYVAQEFKFAPQTLGVVLSAALIGMVIGSILFGALSDRIGRRKVVFASVAVFAAATILVPFVATNAATFIILRFVAGLGLGGLTPVLLALLAEYMPRRLRAISITATVAALSFGGLITGLLATFLIPSGGWRLIFLIGGILPIALAIVVYFALPESIRFLAARGDDSAVAQILRRIDVGSSFPKLSSTSAASEQNTTLEATSVRFFSKGSRGRTVVLWVIFFCNLLVVYTLLNWLPILFGVLGLPKVQASLSASSFALGGVIGGIVVGLILNRVRKIHLTVIVCYLVAVAGLLGVVLANGSFQALLVFALVAGAGVIGGQTGTSVLAAAMYDTRSRGQGVGWAFGVGRVGSIVGPVLSGVLIGAGLGATGLISLATVPTLVAAVGVGFLGLKKSGQKSAESSQQPTTVTAP
jgi:MFS transporter, AAHS family, 4-hydroxybenzoate transporter